MKIQRRDAEGQRQRHRHHHDARGAQPQRQQRQRDQRDGDAEVGVQAVRGGGHIARLLEAALEADALRQRGLEPVQRRVDRSAARVDGC